jgi:undecaprenyl-diphosphatase
LNSDDDLRLSGPPSVEEARRPPMPLLVAALLLALGAALLFGLLGEQVQDQEPVPVDAGATQFLHGFSSPTLDAVMNLVSFLGSAGFVIPVLAVVTILLYRRRRLPEAIFLALVYAGSGALNFLLKLLFHRNRPTFSWSPGAINDYSFPSGHAMNSLVFYLGLALVTWMVFGRRVGVAVLSAGLVIVVLVGISRVYLGLHYVSDVIGGYAAGLIWLLVAAVAMRALWNAVGPSLPFADRINRRS